MNIWGFSSTMRTKLAKHSLCLLSFFCKPSKLPSIFVFSACALQLLPSSILEMTSRQWERRVSLSLSLSLSPSVAASGFSLLPWQQLPLPASVGLPVFIHFCVHAPEELRSALFTLPYMGFYEQWAQGFPRSQINTINDVHTHTHTHSWYTHAQHTHTYTHTAVLLIRHSKLHPFAHNYLHLELNGM